MKSASAETSTAERSITASKIELEDKNDVHETSLKGVVMSAPDNNRFMFSVDEINNNTVTKLKINDEPMRWIAACFQIIDS